MTSQPQWRQKFTQKAQHVSAIVQSVADYEQAARYAVTRCPAHENAKLAAPGLPETLQFLVADHCRQNAIAWIDQNLRAYPEGFAVGLTMADYGIADTGTLVIGSRDENLRLATMLCDIHIAVLPVSCICEKAEDIADQLSAWMQTGGDYTAFITGASRTADIERVLAIGVHGPLELHILLLEDV